MNKLYFQPESHIFSLTNVPNRNKACDSKSVFTGVKVVVPAEVFELTKQFQKDKHPQKVNMGVGGKTWLS